MLRLVLVLAMVVATGCGCRRDSSWGMSQARDMVDVDLGR